MAYLIPDSVTDLSLGEFNFRIKRKITPDGARAHKRVCDYIPMGGKVKPCRAIGADGKPRGITVHNTSDISTAVETTPAEQYARATYPNLNCGGIAVHYWVWREEIWQQLEDSEQGWHAGDGTARRRGHRGELIGGNLDTISIECIGNDAESRKTLAMLVAYLCVKHSLEPELDVYTHNWWMYGVDSVIRGAKKNCPLYILPEWEGFLCEVSNYYHTAKEEDEAMSVLEEVRAIKSEIDSIYGDIRRSADKADRLLSMQNKVSGRRYTRLREVESPYYRPTLDKLLKKGYLTGKGDVGEDSVIDLSEDSIRLLVVMDRARLFDRYERLCDVDASYKPALEQLVASGLLRGRGGDGENALLDLDEDAARLLTVLVRAGVLCTRCGDTLSDHSLA